MRQNANFGMVRRTPRLAAAWNANIAGHIIDLAWSPDGARVAVAIADGAITIFTVKTGEVVATLPGHGFGTTAIAWNADGRYFASSGQDGKIRIWDIAASNERHVMPAGASWAEHVAWSPKGNILASAAGKKVKLWSADGELIRELPDATSTVSDIGWRPGVNELAVSSYGRLAIWSADKYDKPTTDPIRLFEWKGAILVLSWSPDAKYIATGDQDSTVHFWYVQTGEDLQMWGYQTKVRELAWDRTSRYLATGGSPAVVLWDCSGKGPQGTQPQAFREHQDLITTLDFQHKGDMLVSGGADGRVAVWKVNPKAPPANAHQGEAAPSIPATASVTVEAAVTHARWSPDDSLIAVGTEAGDVLVYARP